MALILVLTIALIIAKVAFGVAISWLWVFSPLWIVFIAAIIIGLIQASVVASFAAASRGRF